MWNKRYENREEQGKERESENQKKRRGKKEVEDGDLEIFLFIIPYIVW